MKTLIIGGGMAGLTYGILSVKNGIETVICERNSRVGKKIAVTGNGKCNIGNIDADLNCFNDSGVVRRVLNDISVQTYLDFLQSCGIITFDGGGGRLYPLSESASNVVDCLRFQFAKYGGQLMCETEVSAVTVSDRGYLVNLNGKNHSFDKVVLACGSGSGTIKPDVGNIVDAAWLTPLVPSLVPVKICNMDKSLNGLRAKANVTLLVDGTPVATQSGEVQFKDYGLSGICIFNLSATIARNIVAGRKANYTFSVDVVPQLSVDDLADILAQRSDWDSDKLFLGILHNKVASYVLNKTHSCTPKVLATAAKNLQFNFDKLLDYSMSQVTSGGIDEKFLQLSTLTLPNGVVALGEILNVDGLCGGNNLYFAAASALCLFDEKQRRSAFELK